MARLKGAMFAVACGLMAALILSDGIGISWDSEAYLAAARSVRESGGLPRDWSAFPPLYSLMLAAFTPATMLTGAALINAAAFGLAGALLANILPADRRALLVLAVVLASPALRLVNGWVATEPVFIALVLVFAVGVQRQSWAVMMVAAALAALQRYVGIALIPAGVAALWLMGRRRAIPLFVLGAALPVGIWMIRNWLTGGTLMGVRVAGELSLNMSAQITIDALIGWLPALIVAWVGAPRAGLSRATRAALAIYCVGHIALVLWGSATTNLDAPGDRLLAPVFLPVLLLVAGEAQSAH